MKRLFGQVVCEVFDLGGKGLIRTMLQDKAVLDEAGLGEYYMC